MNTAKLKEAEQRFFALYPGGFSHPAMQEIAKKHKVEKMNKLAQEGFAPHKFDDSSEIVDTMAKVVGQSSLVSVFEKPKFRDLCKSLSSHEWECLASGLREFLHGDQQVGFEQMADLLHEYKLAKWPLLTVCGVYFNPKYEVFVKPTTAKGVIEYFGLEGIKYASKPTYEFYALYRDRINQMKKEVDSSLGLDSASFCGFLMLSMEESKF